MLGADGWRIGAGENRRPSHGADRRIGIGGGELHTLCRKFVDIRRLCLFVAIAPQPVTGVIFRRDPEDIWPIRSSDRWGCQGRKDGKKNEGSENWFHDVALKQIFTLPDKDEARIFVCVYRLGELGLKTRAPEAGIVFETCWFKNIRQTDKKRKLVTQGLA